MAQNVKIRNVVYSDVPYLNIPYADEELEGEFAKFYDTEDGTAGAQHVASGLTFYNLMGKQVGTMPNNGAISETISTKDQAVTIPQGFHNGSGTVQLSATEKAKLISDNVKAGVTLLGVSGKSTVVDTTIASSEAATAANVSRGKKVVVNGVTLTGTLDSVVVSQDPTTKVLTIE